MLHYQRVVYVNIFYVLCTNYWWYCLFSWNNEQVINTNSLKSILNLIYSCCIGQPYRVGIYQANVFCAVSNTTNSALKAGELIADGWVVVGGMTCIMHAQELCLKHALGVAIRKKNNMIIDNFPVEKI